MTPNTMNRSRRLLALGAAALVLSTGACSSGGSDQKADTKSASATTTAPGDESTEDTTTDEATTNDDGDDEASTATTAPEDDAEPLGSSAGRLRADPNDSTPVPLELDILSVERIEGETIEVRFTITNTGDDATFEPWDVLGDPTIAVGGTYDVGGLALLDRPNDKKYLTLYDTADVCLCTGAMAQLEIAPGDSADFYADVTAPPESVDTIDVSVPGFEPVNGLEIS